MTPTRREFIQAIGISLAGLMLTRCVAPPGKSGPTVTPPPTATPVPTARDRVRDCWYRLDDLGRQTLEQGDGEGKWVERLALEHRAALDALVAAGELPAGVAGEIHAAFQAAASHVWRSNAPITCYKPLMGPEYTPASAEQLARQVMALENLAAAGGLDPQTVAQARAAIERDMAFLNLPDAEREALYARLVAAAGDYHNYPSFDEIDLEITPEAVAAAQFLVNLLLAEPPARPEVR